MRKFFGYGLSARRIMWPLWGIMLISVVAALLQTVVDGLIVTNSDGATVADGHFVLFVVVEMVLMWAVMVAMMGLSLPIVRATCEAASFEGEGFVTAYDRRAYMKEVAVGALLSVVTLGLYVPWYYVRMLRFFSEGLSLARRSFGFHAKGMGLFAIITLAYVVPVALLICLVDAGVLDGLGGPDMVPTLALGVVIFLILMMVWMSLLCALVARWAINMSVGEKRIVGNVSPTKTTLFVLGQLTLTMLTLGLYTPMMELRMMHYFASVTVVGEGRDALRGGMILRSWRDWAYVWGQALLLVVTLGLYMPWYVTRLLNRFVPRLYLTAEK